MTLKCDFNFFLTYSVLQSHKNSPRSFGRFGKGPKLQSRYFLDVSALMQCNGIQVSAQETNACLISNYLA